MLAVLVVEDDPLIGQATERWLAQQHQEAWVINLADARSTLIASDIDIVLRDPDIP